MSESNNTGRMQISKNKKPVSTYVHIAKRLLAENSEGTLEISALGIAMTTVASVAEVMRKEGLVTIEKIDTSMVKLENARNVEVEKARLSVLVKKTAKLDSVVAEEEAARASQAASEAAAAAAPSS